MRRNPDIDVTNALDNSAHQSVNGEDHMKGTQLVKPAEVMAQSNETDVFAQALTPKVAVSYLRVSTRDQARRGGGDDEGFSIPAQRDANRRKAASLGAIITKEFVDRGASARSANRPELQGMLEYLADHDVDYVIVHKLDRLARSRADDVEISKALDELNVRLVSTTESIDQTPSGMLLHGIMSSIAEFYSRNLAAEVMKGMTQKARSGGTVGRAPLGYRNQRTVDSDGREMRTVVLDHERAPLVALAFDLYATGDWSISGLVEHLNKRGLTTTPSPRMPARPITEGHLHKVLINPYYKGQTKFQGVHYEGRHETLVDESKWQRVQDVLASHVNGERVRKHPHFLKSTVYCGQCGERLMVSLSTSASGTQYPYFYCVGRHSKRTNCTLRSVLIYEVEKKLEDHYEHMQLEPAFRANVEVMIRDEFRGIREHVETEQGDLKREKEKLERERRKLMEAHYEGAVPVDLLGQEQNRIAKALQKISSQLAATNLEFEAVERNLQLALDLTVDCGAAYRHAPDDVKRMFNQAFFEKVLVIQEDASVGDIRVEAEFREPFGTLLGSELKSVEAAFQGAHEARMSNNTPRKGNGRVAPGFHQVNSLSKTLFDLDPKSATTDVTNWP
jgi:DNA invertase Pin-like site-specific DNA recombinase